QRRHRDGQDWQRAANRRGRRHLQSATRPLAELLGGFVRSFFGRQRWHQGDHDCAVGSGNNRSTEPDCPSSLSVSPGGSIPMGITATPVDSDDTVSITIKGVPSYEKITAGPGETVTTTKGAGNTTTYTITSTTPGAAITDLTLTSTYNK